MKRNSHSPSSMCLPAGNLLGCCGGSSGLKPPRGCPKVTGPTCDPRVTLGVTALHPRKPSLCKVRKISGRTKGNPPHWVTQDARAICHLDADARVKAGTTTWTDFMRSDPGNLGAVTRGATLGRTGVTANRERHRSRERRPRQLPYHPAPQHQRRQQTMDFPSLWKAYPPQPS